MSLRHYQPLHSSGVSLALAQTRNNKSFCVDDDVAGDAAGLHACFAAQALGQEVYIRRSDRFDCCESRGEECTRALC